LEEVKEGVTELELKEKLLTFYGELGAQGESFDTIVAFGKNSAVPHHQTGVTVLERGMPILIDTGCLVDGYASDFTRTVYFGKPTKEFISAYNAVKQANEYAIENIKDGTYTDQADGYARAVLKKYGLEEYFTHSLGHGLGLEIHEYPTLSIKRKDRLENKMLFTIEPGVYFDGKFGIRIEDTVLLDGKAERLYTDKKDLIIL
jgi:Xaa-Pro aminopeptidase